MVELILDGSRSLDDVHEVGDCGQPFLDNVGGASFVAYRRPEGLNDILHGVE